jgi:hypothetical protein
MEHSDQIKMAPFINCLDMISMTEHRTQQTEEPFVPQIQNYQCVCMRTTPQISELFADRPKIQYVRKKDITHGSTWFLFPQKCIQTLAVLS